MLQTSYWSCAITLDLLVLVLVRLTSYLIMQQGILAYLVKLNSSEMNFLEYLYCKYYNFQVRMGNADVAPFSSMLIIAFIFMLYYFSLFFLAIIFIPKGLINMQYFKYFSILLFFYSIVHFYFLLVHKGKYKKVLKRCDAKNKGSIGAILFPLIAFVLFNVGWILKMFQNQGKF